MRYITELHNARLNEPIWISGADPSIDGYPDDFMDNKIAIVLHHAYLKFPNTQYCHANEQDRVAYLKEFHPEYMDKTCMFAFPFYGRRQRDTEKIINADRANYFFFILRAATPHVAKPDWVTEKVAQVRAGGVMDFGGYGTCLHACIYVCVVMGCNPINIIGCEHKAVKGQPEYFGAAQEASVGQFKRNHVVLGPRQKPGTLALIEACRRNEIVVNRYFSYEETL